MGNYIRKEKMCIFSYVILCKLVEPRFVILKTLNAPSRKRLPCYHVFKSDFLLLWHYLPEYHKKLDAATYLFYSMIANLYQTEFQFFFNFSIMTLKY